jgi:4-alpha-methyl-delta7-sterol-4alpha-methyl oxidase
MMLFENVGGFGVFIFAYTMMAAIYAAGSYLLYLVDKHRWLDQYKIQKGKYATKAEYLDCAKYLLKNYVFLILPLGVVSFPVTRFLGMSYTLPLPAFSTWCIHILCCLMGEDFLHYWIHRYLHTPWAYKNIHKVHHTYLAPFGLTASFAHPIEILMEGFATFMPALLIRPHFFTFYSWFILRQFDALFTHCGYNLPFPLSPFEWVPFFGGAAFHDYHHKAFTCNYASRFTYLDKIFGTYKEEGGDERKKVK